MLSGILCFSFLFTRDRFSKDVLPLLKFIMKNGNSSVYQWKYGKVPSQIIINEVKNLEEEEIPHEEEPEVKN